MFVDSPALPLLRFLLEANGADPAQKFHEGDNLHEYNRCMWELRDGKVPSSQTKTLAMAGMHYPTTILTNFRDPPVRIPAEVDAEMSAGRGAAAATPVEEPVQVTQYLHQSLGLKDISQGQTEGAPAPSHAYVLPYYDTNIGHWMKQYGSMNLMQSYEMQSLLRPGDVVVDAGANLGCYTMGFAEKVGLRGAVLSFEPFRWMFQLLTANVALNGLQNVWTIPAGLSDVTRVTESQPPQLRFFSSPGGVKIHNQTEGLKEQDVYQLYDMDMPKEKVTELRLDDLLFPQQPFVGWPVPEVNDVRLIKIDVEGMEKEVIRGAQQVVMNYRPIIWTENVDYFQSENTAFLELVDSMGYSCAKAQNAPNDLICTDRFGRGHQI